MVWVSFKSALLGVLIAFVALLPPLVHLVTGPLGPAIGGFVAGNRQRARLPVALLTGLFMGLVVGVVSSVGTLAVWGVGASVPDIGFQVSLGNAVLIPLGVAAYVIVMSTIGASLGGYVARRRNKSTEER